MPSLKSKAISESKAIRELELARQRIAVLEKTVDRQLEQIESYRKSKFKLPNGSKSRISKGAFCRVVIPDSHGSAVDPLAVAAFLGDLESIAPAEVVMLGDHLECGGFLAQHHTLGYVAQSEYTFEQDVIACNQLLDQVCKFSPKATIEYIEGNHERRIETWIITQVQKNRQDGNYLRKMFSTDSVLSLEKRGIRWIRQGVFYDGLSVPSTIRKGHCHFTHGSSTAQHSASVHVRKFGGNVVYGHTHRADSFVIRTVKEGSIGAWCPGCLCILQPLWQHTNPTEWTHGYGLQLVNPDGTFLHINVPIIDSRSYLQPLVKAIA